MDRIIERIEREAGIPDLAAILAERLEPTDLQSLLLEVSRRRARQRRPTEVLAEYESNRFVQPSRVSPERLATWDTLLWKTLPDGFEPITLSPVCPLGTSTVVAGVDPNWSVATIRNSEVVSDCTNVLALECAVRRRRLLQITPKSAETVHLATSHRLLRPQFSANPKMLPHFSLFALTTAGRDLGSLRFELATLETHLRFYLTAVRSFLGEATLQVTVTDFAPAPRLDRLETDLLVPIRAAFPGVECRFDQERVTGRGYYRDLCFHIYLVTPEGERLNLADGGSVDWTQKYLSSAKERLIISGIGSECLCGLTLTLHAGFENRTAN